MRQIKVTYRAIFRQPTGVLNSMGAIMNGQYPVEVFGHGDKWQARNLDGMGVFAKLSKFASAAHGRQVVEESFLYLDQAWQMWAALPYTARQILEEGVSRDPRIIQPHEITVLGDGKVLWKEPEDYLHIIHAPTLAPGERIPSAACGAKVKADCFISTKANVEPTCKACAEVWRREYKGK